MFHKDYFNFISLTSVLSGNRDIGRLVVSEKECRIITKYLDTIEFYHDSIKRAETKDGFVFEGGKNKYKCTQDDLIICKEKNIYLYVSRSKELNSKLKDAEINGSTKSIGTLLGYPQCCIESHSKLIHKRKISDIDILKETLIKSSKSEYHSFYTNYGAYGKTLILHFPCKYDCKESIRIGVQNLELIYAMSKEFGKYVESCLKSTMFISDEFIINLEDNNIEKGKVYDKHTFTTKGVRCDSVMVLSDNQVRVNDKKYRGDFVYFR